MENRKDGTRWNVALCIKKKKKAWIWLAVNRSSGVIIDFVIGTKGVKTGKELWNKIKDIDCEKYCSDYWEAYQKFLPKDKHIQTKAETFTVEGMNNQLRHYIARFHRKTRCYSKNTEMIENTILLFMNKNIAVSMVE